MKSSRPLFSILSALALSLSVFSPSASAAATFDPSAYSVTGSSGVYNSAANTTTFTYTVHSASQLAISHWILEICQSAAAAVVATNDPAGGVWATPDQGTSSTVYGYKFNTAYSNGETRTVTLTLRGYWESGTIAFEIKAGGQANFVQGTTIGPVGCAATTPPNNFTLTCPASGTTECNDQGMAFLTVTQALVNSYAGLVVTNPGNATVTLSSTAVGTKVLIGHAFTVKVHAVSGASSGDCSFPVMVADCDHTTTTGGTPTVLNLTASLTEECGSTIQSGDIFSQGLGLYAPDVITVAYYDASGSPLNFPYVVPAGGGTIKFTATDGIATVEGTATLTVVDTTTPAITAADVNVSAPSDACSASVSVDYAIDDCSNTTQSYTSTIPGHEGPVTLASTSGTISLSDVPVGSYTLTISATDPHPNTGSQTVNITVKDVTAPSITWPSLAASYAADENCSANVTLNFNVTDNCSGVTVDSITVGADSVSYSQGGTYLFPVGPTTVTVVAHDAAGNSTTQSFTVTVVDTIPPVISDLPDLTVYTGPGATDCSAIATYSATATDNCGAATVTFDIPSGSSFSGTTTVTATATDSHGNKTTKTFTVTVIDNTPPVISALPNLTVYTGPGAADCNAIANYSATATDNCDGSTPVQFDISSGSSFSGTTTVTATATDSHGNTATTTFTVTVVDNTPPAAPTVADATFQCGGSISAPTAVDNCSGPITGVPSGPTTFTEQGDYAVTWTFVDANGNSSTAVQLVHVHDTEAPVAPVLSDVSFQCGGSISVPTALDNCVGVVIGTTTSATTFTEQGDYTVTWAFADGHGNVSYAVQHVGVHDTEAPVAPTLATVVGECSAAVTAPTALDNCAGSVIGTTSDPVVYTSEGTYTVHWKFTDGHGNTSYANQKVVVTDGSAKISGVVFVDSNVNGTKDASEAGLGGWTVKLYSGPSASGSPLAATVTAANGSYFFAGLHSGTYTVVEVVPTGSYNTSPTSSTVTVACGGTATASFGDVTLGAGGALSQGFWSNKNGATVFNTNTTGNLAILNSMNLRDAKGAKVTFTTQAQFGTFETSTTATNIANMLSSQFAAVQMDVSNSPYAKYDLNIANGGNAIVYAPGTLSANAYGFATLNALLAEAKAELGSYAFGIVTPSNKVAYETTLKNVFDSVCNNKNFVQ